MTTVEQFFAVLEKSCSKTRLAAAQADKAIGYFWDSDVLSSEDKMQQGMATHLDLLASLIEQKLAKDLSRTTISEGIRVLDKRHKGELYCATCGNYKEWLRAEGNVFKKLLGFIRVTEHRSIDFSRQSACNGAQCRQPWAARGSPLKSSLPERNLQCCSRRGAPFGSCQQLK